MEVITLEQAKQRGLKKFYTGVPCKHGHLSQRYVSNKGGCVECDGSSRKRRYVEDIRNERSYHRRKTQEWRDRNVYELGSDRWITGISSGAKSRAKAKGIPFDEKAVREYLSNPPTHCPVFGHEFVVSKGNNKASATLDRIRPELGYVKGNLALISRKANAIKNDASVEELRQVLTWLAEQIN